MEKVEMLGIAGEGKLTMECAWCKAAGLPSEENRRSSGEIAGFDELLGRPVCKKCIDAAFMVEKMLIDLQSSNMYVQAV